MRVLLMLADTAVSGVARATHGADGAGAGGGGGWAGGGGGGRAGGGDVGGGADGGPPHGRTCTSYRLRIRVVPGSVMLTYRPSPTHGTLNGPAVDAAVYVAHVTRCAES